jgi:hypothetical protein
MREAHAAHAAAAQGGAHFSARGASIIAAAGGGGGGGGGARLDKAARAREVGEGDEVEAVRRHVVAEEHGLPAEQHGGASLAGWVEAVWRR